VIHRLEWLRTSAAAIIHRRLQNMPDDLAGLCRLRIGDYRILYWHYAAKQMIKIYRVQHRSEVYRDL
jgi:mRNA interferase RelE/StbE